MAKHHFIGKTLEKLLRLTIVTENSKDYLLAPIFLINIIIFFI